MAAYPFWITESVNLRTEKVNKVLVTLVYNLDILHFTTVASLQNTARVCSVSVAEIVEAFAHSVTNTKQAIINTFSQLLFTINHGDIQLIKLNLIFTFTV